MDKNLNIKFNSVEEYFSSVSPDARKKLIEISRIVKKVVPSAEEVISYNMPAFKYYGILIYYAAHKEHIGFYPANSSLIIKLKDELLGFETSKGTIKFPIDKPLPVMLIKSIIEIREKENLDKLTKKQKRKI
jgi:uncharacterized protein YdhG (YjbR/CyaY superfamily)